MILHVGGASTAAVLVTVIAIFFLIFAVSFAIGAVPEGGRRFSAGWIRAWFRASLPRFVVAAAFSTLLFVGSSLSGSGGTTDAQACDSPLAPLTVYEVSRPRLDAAISGMQDIAAAARAGDATAVRSLFLTTDAHSTTHDIAGPLFAADRDLARSLCESVLGLENEIAGALRPEVIAVHAEAIAGTLQEAHEELDFGPTASPIAPGPCDLPLAAVSLLPITDERLTAAIASFSETARLAAEGDVDAAGEAFSGDAHDITHDIDGPLRAADRDLAVALCESVLEIERQFATAADTGVIAAESETSAGLLEKAGRVLGLGE